MTLLPYSICGLVVLRLVSVIDLLTFLYLLVIPSAAQPSDRSSYVVISTKLGQVRGMVVQATDNGTCKEDCRVTTQFFGVPYALPPVGRLRFQEPQKVNGWILQGVLNATVPRRHCPVKPIKHHVPTETSDEAQAEESREDCLHLNIYVPGNLSSTAYIDAMELPVLVIFSEEERADLSVLQQEALSRLACYGRIVVIDLSYRSGVLSYLSGSGEKLTFGNNGFQDQRLAMLWIWDNVREFGGNPEEITIFAERQASISLGFHILQPDSRGLFARAVMHSGVPRKDYFELNYSDLTSEVASAVGCGDFTLEGTDCLQFVALDKLLEAAEAFELNHTSWRGQVTDIKLVPSQVLESLDSGVFGQVDLLIGSSEHDGLCFLRETNEPKLLNKMSRASMDTFIRSIMRSQYRNASRSEKTLRTVVDAVSFEYSSSCSVGQNLTEVVARFITDMMYRAPAEWKARLMSRQDNSVYLYVISSKNHSCSSLKSLVSLMECSEKPVNRLAKNAIDILVNFVRKGNPNPLNGLNNWRPFTERERHFLHFIDEEMLVKQNINQRKMAFWNDYFPYLLDSDLDSCQPELVLPESSMDDESDDETVKISLLFCFVAAIVLLLLILFIFLLMRLHRSHVLPSRRCVCCFGCCRTGQRQNRHDLMIAAVAAAGPDDEDNNLHPLPYDDESAWN